MKLKDKITNNVIVRKAYGGQFYFNIGSNLVGLVSQKLNEISSFIIIMGYLKINVVPPVLGLIIVSAAVGLTIFGYVWKHIGMYDTEQEVNAEKNPVQYRILKAADIMIRFEKLFERLEHERKRKF